MLRPFAATLPLAVLLLIGCQGEAPTSPDEDATPETEEWRLVWEDAFEDDGLPDSTKWTYDAGGHGWGNEELQYYTERRAENARVEDGRLVIEARQEPWNENDYTSARLVSQPDWTYGRFEVRAKLPAGRGTWPAVWMLPTNDTYGDAYWPDNGEIDIMEHVGFAPDTVHATVHTKAYNHMIGTHRGSAIHVPNARTDFNTYAVEWAPETIRGFVNGEPYFTFPNERRTDTEATYAEWPFDRPFHFVLNIAVGGTWGGAEGVAPDIWPQRMEIDYVRVFQRGE